jgi:hypothetical protein
MIKMNALCFSLIPAHRLDAVLQRPQNAGQKPGGAGEQIRSSSGNRFGHANQNKLGKYCTTVSGAILNKP